LTWFLFFHLSYAAWTTLRHAAFPWFTWYDTYFDIAEDYLLPAVWSSLPCLWLMAALLLRRLMALVFRRWGARPAVEVRRFWRIAARLVTGIVLLASGGPLAAALALNLGFYGPELSMDAVRGATIVESRCGSCHAPVVPLAYRRKPELWGAVVNRMRTRRKVKLTDGEARQITAYLELRAAYSDRQLFLAKCQRCHFGVGDTNRSGDEWAMIIQRAARVSPFAFPDDWKEQLTRHARVALSSGVKPVGEQKTRLRFQQVCGRCHSLARARSVKKGDRIIQLLRRMAAKEQGALAPGDIAGMALFIGRIPEVGDGFRQMFPHDRPVEVTW